MSITKDTETELLVAASCVVYRFDRHLDAKGYIARGGQMVDASIVPAPKPRNTREENEALQRGKTPPAWEEKPARIGKRTRTRAGSRSTARASLVTRTT